MTPQWLDWLAENRLRGCSEEALLRAMRAGGVADDAALAAIDSIEAQPLYGLAARLDKRLGKLESVVAALQKQWELAPRYASIERRGALSEAQFLHDHVVGQRPVVLTELARDWPALQRWTPEALKQRFGDVQVEVQSRRDSLPDYEVRMHELRTEMPLAEFVDRVLAAGSDNDIYLTANNHALKRPGLTPLLDDIGSLPAYIDRARLPGEALLWFGPAGTCTPLHHDTLMLFHTQIIGRKHWRFVSPLETPRLDNRVGVFSPLDLAQPDLARWPALADVTVLEVTVEPGETLFVPVGWWHQVRSLDVCISLSFTNVALPNEFSYRNP